MKVTTILGSPRTSGNSSTIANLLVSKLRSKITESKVFELNKLNYRGCQGCMVCKTKLEKCTVADDLSEVLEAVKETDVLILSSPVYVGEITAQLKGLIDRFYSFLNPNFHSGTNVSRLQPGKKLIFIISQGNGDEKSFSELLPRYDKVFSRHGFDFYPIRALGVGPSSDVRTVPEIIKLIDVTANKLLSAS